MGKVADSLKENMEFIKSALPDGIDLDEDTLPANVEAMLEPLGEEEQKQAIVAELTANPDVDHAECIPAFESAPDAHKSPEPASQEELDTAMKEMLAEREAEQSS